MSDSLGQSLSADGQFFMDNARREARYAPPDHSVAIPDSALTRKFTLQARDKFAAHTKLLLKLEHQAAIPAAIDFSARLDTALETSADLLNKAKAQPAAPCIASDDLTPEEIAQLEREAEWDRIYAKSAAIDDSWLARNDGLLNEVIGFIDEVEDSGIPIHPDLKASDPPETSLEDLVIPEGIKTWIKMSKKHISPPVPYPSTALQALRHTKNDSGPRRKPETKRKGQGKGSLGAFAKLLWDVMEESAVSNTDIWQKYPGTMFL